VLTGLAPLRRLVVPVERHFRADEGAAYLTRYPPGLISALRKLASQPGGASLSNLGLNHLWIVDPLQRAAAPSSTASAVAPAAPDGPAAPAAPPEEPERLFPSHPPLEERVEKLREL
jgi:heat shock protein HtpX